MKKDRVEEIHFYEWRVTSWLSSPTRDRLNATGRGIYRELLDACYVQGWIPYDLDWMAQRANCTREEIDAVWPILKPHFLVSKKDSTRLVNKFSELFRRNYFAFLRSQKKNRKKGIDKANQDKQLHDGGQKKPRPIRDETIRDDTKRDDTTAAATATDCLDVGEWPKAAAAVRSRFPETDMKFITGLIADCWRPGLVDCDLSDAIRLATKNGQRSAALYRKTVPAVLDSLGVLEAVAR